MLKSSLLDHLEYLAEPKRITSSAWQEHVPFAMFLVAVARPRVLVELGTYSGESYCAFCQAIAELRLDAQCFAVDTWQGDSHSGLYGPDVFDELRIHHDALYGRFSRLVQTTFDKALDQFQDESIDLLHIDGCHTYEAVKHDFEAWFPKVRPGGLILLHDTAEVERDFGVKRFWEEISPHYQHFEFSHGHGLGILAKGEPPSEELRELFALSAEDASRFRAFFAGLGRLHALRAVIAARDIVIESQSAENVVMKAEYARVMSSATIALLNKYRRQVEWLLPVSTRRRRLHDRLIAGGQIIVKDGWGVFSVKFGRWIGARLRLIDPNEPRTLSPKASDRTIIHRQSAERESRASDKTKTPQGSSLTKKIRVAFVGQAVYFRFMYERDLDPYYDVKEFELRWGADSRFYQALVDFKPDVTFFFRPEFYPDDTLASITGLKIGLSSEPIPKYIGGKLITSDDMKIRFESLKGVRRKNFDRLFHYDSTSLKYLRENGFDIEEFVFPVATGTYRPIDLPKKWDWGFIGRDTSHRDGFLGFAKRDLQGLHVAHGVYSDDFVQMVNQCRIGVNLHVDANISLEPRVQMMMACGVMVMSEPLSPNGVFEPGVHFVEFASPEEFSAKMKYYLEHESERRRIALNGYRLVRERLEAVKVFPELIGRLLPSAEQPLRSTTKQATSLGVTDSVLKLDLGCGKSKKEGFVGLDIEQFDCVDVVADLNLPIPFPDGSVNEIFCSHALEHVKDPFHLLEEMYRVSTPGAKLELVVPIHEPDATHFTIFDEAWLRRNIDPKRFRIISSEVASKSGISPSGYPHAWTEQRMELQALPDGAPAKRLNTNDKGHRKPSVGFVIPGTGISGGVMVVCQHANRLVAKGYDVVIIDQDTGDPRKLDWFPGLMAEVVPMNGLQRSVDVAVATHWSTAYAVNDLRARRKIYLVQSDETRFNPPGSEASQKAHATYKFNFEFVVIARWLQRWLRDSYGKTSCYVPNGVDPLLFFPDEPLVPKKDKLRVLLEGPIDVPFKGMEDAFQVVQGLDCDVWCVSTLGRPKRGWHCDTFFDGVSQEKMRKIYSSCDVILKMSRVEGFFMPPLEMMACGGTVVTGKVTGYDEYIVDGYNALVVDQGDVASARIALELLIKDRSLLQTLKSGGAETAKSWGWEVSSNIFEDLIVSPDREQ